MGLFSRLFGRADGVRSAAPAGCPAPPPRSGAADGPPAEVYLGLRARVLSLTPADLGLPPDRPVAALMETGYPGAVATLVAVADGTTSLYLGTGGGVIGAGGHEPVRAASGAFLAALAAAEGRLGPEDGHPLPDVGRVRFRLVTAGGVRTAEASERDLADGRHGLSPVFRAGQAVIAAVRENTPDGP